MPIKRVRIQSIFRKDVYVSDYHDNGQLEAHLHYRYGRLHGAIEFFHDNSQLHIKATFNMGKTNGLFESYFENGQLEKKHILDNGVIQGLAESYYENGQSEYKTHYASGELDGTSVWHYEDGQLKQSAQYAWNHPDGLHQTYYENGQLEGSTEWIMGYLDGPEHRYYDDGQLASQRQFNHGLVDGIALSYHANGKLWNKTNYNNGPADGPSETYDDLGKLTSQSNYKDGIPEVIIPGDGRTATCERGSDDNHPVTLLLLCLGLTFVVWTIAQNIGANYILPKWSYYFNSSIVGRNHFLTTDILALSIAVITGISCYVFTLKRLNSGFTSSLNFKFRIGPDLLFVLVVFFSIGMDRVASESIGIYSLIIPILGFIWYVNFGLDLVLRYLKVDSQSDDWIIPASDHTKGGITFCVNFVQGGLFLLIAMFFFHSLPSAINTFNFYSEILSQG